MKYKDGFWGYITCHLLRSLHLNQAPRKIQSLSLLLVVEWQAVWPLTFQFQLGLEIMYRKCLIHRHCWKTIVHDYLMLLHASTPLRKGIYKVNVCIKRHSRKVKPDIWSHPLVIKVKPSLPSPLLYIPSYSSPSLEETCVHSRIIILQSSSLPPPGDVSV